MAIGCDASDIEPDAAAVGQPPQPVLQKDEFNAQLDKLNHLVRSQLLSSGGDRMSLVGDTGGPVPTAALFKSSADSTR